MATTTRRRGTVTEFDDAIGLGVVTDAQGAALPFHCTAIADGSRSIPIGADVHFDVVPGRSGRWEATSLVAAD